MIEYKRIRLKNVGWYEWLKPFVPIVKEITGRAEFEIKYQNGAYSIVFSDDDSEDGKDKVEINFIDGIDRDIKPIMDKYINKIKYCKKGCMVCVKQCHTGCLTLRKGDWLIIDNHKCSHCLNCYNVKNGCVRAD